MHNTECIIAVEFKTRGQGAWLLADCKGRAFTPLRQQLPTRAIRAPNKQNAVLRSTPLAFSRLRVMPQIKQALLALLTPLAYSRRLRGIYFILEKAAFGAAFFL